ncbi:hypothetical protein [Streptomyces sp. TLI_146]|uniref:hypothetical protein n=1 Tax=Streptomyces sp. TLI_146 TaxID=1938858 RepID=UPI000C70FFDE|nr:hypothetical protein [Streptomyces sp. TLI_146]
MLWPYVLAWAERSFIISDLAEQHRPTSPPLTSEEQQLWTDLAQAAWRRGDLEADDVWYSAANELITRGLSRRERRADRSGAGR